MRDSSRSDGESDQAHSPSHTLHDLLEDLNTQGSSNVSRIATHAHGPRERSVQVTTSSSWLPATRSTSALEQNQSHSPSTAGQARHSSSTPSPVINNLDQTSASSVSQAPTAAPQSSTVFSNPHRSIFTSGQPTSSVSANTAHASMSAPGPASTSRPFAAALSGPSTSTLRRPPAQSLSYPLPLSPRAAGATEAEKDADDPSTAFDDSHTDRQSRLAPMALSQLFTENPEASPTVSRHGSYLRTLSGTKFVKDRPFEHKALAPHVYGQGLLSGKFSDLTVHAFGSSYRLHRLILDRAPFFNTALSGPWMEANQKEMTLDPADVDANITQAAFELALKRIYGCQVAEEEDKEAVGLFAVGCWLEMDDLLEASIASLLRQMCPSRLSGFIQFVTANYYGQAGDRILASAKAMLCKDGWQMPIRYWDGISGDIIAEVVGSDGFFVPGEWDRWVLAKRLLNRNLRKIARQSGLVDVSERALNAPQVRSHTAVRLDPNLGQPSPEIDRDVLGREDPWLALYAHPDIIALLALLDDGIHYVHLSFEQLQKIRNQRDAVGFMLLPDRIISTALWMQMELRQKIVNADESALELGLTQYVENVEAALLHASQVLTTDEEKRSSEISSHQVNFSTHSSTEDTASYEFSSAKAAGKRVQVDPNQLNDDEAETLMPDTWEALRRPRKFWIPTSDATFPVGEFLSYSDSKSRWPLRSPRLRENQFSVSLSGEDMNSASELTSPSHTTRNQQTRPRQPSQRAPPFQALGSSSASESPTIASMPSPQVSFTSLPPFRFSVEFPAARMLKENRRFYSNTLWHAGSLWNVYVQKKETVKGVQLGVYLHRERQSENSDILLANYAAGHSVDERIGRLEKEMEARRRAERRAASSRESDNDPTLMNAGADLDTISGTLSRPSRRQRPDPLPLKDASSSAIAPSACPRSHDNDHSSDDYLGDDHEEDSDDSVREPWATSSLLTPQRSTQLKVPTLPPYIDARPTIKTYFKIYTPSKGGRVLTVYESRPDKFNFSQSWGWKSGNLELDGGESPAEGGSSTRDSKLRFMIVVGTV